MQVQSPDIMNEIMDLLGVKNNSVYVLKIYSGELGVIDQKEKNNAA